MEQRDDMGWDAHGTIYAVRKEIIMFAKFIDDYHIDLTIPYSATNIHSDDTWFATAKPGLVTALGITEAQADEMLEGCKV